MTRSALRHPVMLALAGVGIASAALVYVPAVMSLVQIRVQIGAPAGEWCVSAAGALHGPDSPYRAMVPASRCHPTRAAAEAALSQE